MLRRVIAVSMVGVIMLVAFAAMVLAQDEGVRYFACVNNASGTIQMIDEGETCGGNEIPVEWNQQGPVGPQGPQGPKGDPGSGGSFKIVPRTSEEFITEGDTSWYYFRCLDGEMMLDHGVLNPADGGGITGNIDPSVRGYPAPEYGPGYWVIALSGAPWPYGSPLPITRRLFAVCANPSDSLTYAPWDVETLEVIEGPLSWGGPFPTPTPTPDPYPAYP